MQLFGGRPELGGIDSACGKGSNVEISVDICFGANQRLIHVKVDG